MSVKVMSWVWSSSRSAKTDRLVLLAIADCANEDGRDAYPSMAELVRKTGLSERAVQMATKRLVKLGELFVSPNGGPRGCNRYRVLMDGRPPLDLHPADYAPPPQVVRESMSDRSQEWNVTPAESAPRTECTPQETTPAPAADAPGTVLEPSAKNSSSKSSKTRRATRIPPDFAVTDAMATWAHAEAVRVRGTPPDPSRWPDWLARQTEDFRDYWAGRPGGGGTKLDWVATWRNRIRHLLDGTATRYPGREIAVRDGPATSDRKVEAARQAGREVQAMLEGRRG